MKPLEAWDRALMASLVLSAERRPGALIERLPKDVREGLSRLTSDELARMRVELGAK